MDEINYSDFEKIVIKTGNVLEAINVEGSDKLIRMEVDFGELGKRIVFSGIRKWYKPENLKGKSFVFVVNLASRKIMNEESQAMALGAEDGDDYVLLVPQGDVPPGTKVY